MPSALPHASRAPLVLLALGACACACARPAVALNPFGVAKLYRDAGRAWYSKWDGPARTFGSTVDPADPEFDADHGPASYSVANGVLSVSGEVPRMYIHDAARALSWRNVEVTAYGMRIDDTNISYGGLMAYARTNHGTVGSEDRNLCDDRGYGGMVTYRGTVQFEKEVDHCADERGGHGYAQTTRITRWPEGMPRNRWIGYKFVVRDAEAGTKVRLELWLDDTDGAAGGRWVRVLAFVDDGSSLGKNADCDGHACNPCAPGVDPALPLTSSDQRAGSETHRPNATVYFRSDGVGAGGLLLKKMSVREIPALP